MGPSTTNYALDVAGGLPEVIYTSEGNLYLHLPGVIMVESTDFFIDAQLFEVILTETGEQ